MKVWSKFGVLVGTLSVVLRQKSSNYETFLGLNFLFFFNFSNEFQAHSRSGPPTLRLKPNILNVVMKLLYIQLTKNHQMTKWNILLNVIF
jgi:hypothetical protein